MTSQQLWALFEATYLATDFDVTYHAHHLFEEGDKQGIELEVTVGRHAPQAARRRHGSHRRDCRRARAAHPHRQLRGACARSGADASALAIVEAARDGVAGIRYGVGRHANIATASVLAVLTASRRLGVCAKDLKLAG